MFLRYLKLDIKILKGLNQKWRILFNDYLFYDLIYNCIAILLLYVIIVLFHTLRVRASQFNSIINNFNERKLFICFCHIFYFIHFLLFLYSLYIRHVLHFIFISLFFFYLAFFLLLALTFYNLSNKCFIFIPFLHLCTIFFIIILYFVLFSF